MTTTTTILGRLHFFETIFSVFFCVEGEVDIGCSFQWSRFVEFGLRVVFTFGIPS